MCPRRGTGNSATTTTTPINLESLEKAADQAGAKAFVTTEKDEQNLKKAQPFRRPVHVAVIDFVLSNESEFLAAIDRALSTRRGAAA